MEPIGAVEALPGSSTEKIKVGTGAVETGREDEDAHGIGREEGPQVGGSSPISTISEAREVLVSGVCSEEDRTLN